MGSLMTCLAAIAVEGAGEDLTPRSPGPLEDSPAEQSAWLDHAIPRLTAAMRPSREVRAKVSGALAAAKIPPSSLRPRAGGLTSGDLERLSALVHAAVVASPRYGRGAAKARPRLTVAVMPRTGIVRVEVTYPAPPAEKDLEPGPLTIDAWVCPDRETALALFWLRSGTPTFDATSPETARRTVLDDVSHPPPIDPKEAPPGEAAAWHYPRLAISVVLPKGHKPMPADRFCFLRGNVVVEASTVEFTWSADQQKWLAWPLDQCAPDVMAVMRPIDAAVLTPR